MNKENCPKCGYKRSKQDDEMTQKTDCPSCGIIYAKFKKNVPEEKITESQGNNNVGTEEESVKFSYKYAGIAAFLILCLFIYGGYSENQSKSTNQTSQKYNTVPQKPVWKTSESRDEMTGKFNAYAFSPTIYPSKRMDFPYSDVNSWMGVGCENGRDWVYFGFNKAPNLNNDETKDGYNLIRTRVKWDEQLERVSLTQSWGAKALHFLDDASAISKTSSSNKVLLELQWHGQGSTYFEYSLDGAWDAIATIRSKCASN